MKIYLAGGITGNLHSYWKEVIRIYLSGTTGGSAKHAINEAMKVYLAGGNIGYKWSGDYDQKIQDQKPYILESFFYIKNQHDWILKMRPFFKDFILDSGAFTYLNGLKDKPDWDNYIEEYADFINKHDVKYFIELDIDSVVGIKEVERLRNKLEKLTNKKSIPVWHKSRGLEYWKKMCIEYDYVAIGGIVTKEIKRQDYKIFIPLLKIAREHNCKVHGLGFTNMEGIKTYPFYSVDSTAWLYGNRGGFIYQFNGSGLDKISEKKMRLKGRAAAAHNFNEWLKFSKYAEQYL